MKKLILNQTARHTPERLLKVIRSRNAVGEIKEINV